MRGEWADAFPTTGILGYGDRETLIADRNSLGRVYVVFSYDTPIAWWGDGIGWKVPDVRYSVTTSRHQSAVRLAASVTTGETSRPAEWDGEDRADEDQAESPADPFPPYEFTTCPDNMPQCSGGRGCPSWEAGRR